MWLTDVDKAALPGWVDPPHTYEPLPELAAPAPSGKTIAVFWAYAFAALALVVPAMVWPAVVLPTVVVAVVAGFVLYRVRHHGCTPDRCAACGRRVQAARWRAYRRNLRAERRRLAAVAGAERAAWWAERDRRTRQHAAARHEQLRQR